MNTEITIKHFDTEHTFNVRINENGAFAETEEGRDIIYRGEQKTLAEIELFIKKWMNENWTSPLSHYFV